MKNNSIKGLIISVSLCVVSSMFCGNIPKNIILKNASAFDIVYKGMPANEVVYLKGQQPTYEENLIKAGEYAIVPTYERRPIKLAIKRYGYGSALSPWTDVSEPERLASEQLNPDQYQRYRLYTEDKDKMPIVTIKSGYTGGWSFGIGYMN